MSGSYETLLVEEGPESITITLNRPSSQNAIDTAMLNELNAVLDKTLKDPRCRLIVLAGQPGVFCTGMDFNELSAATQKPVSAAVGQGQGAGLYMSTIKRLTLEPRLIVSIVDGRAMAGGIGLVAASDWVIATPRSQFSLSEALWGLLPAMVAPYLIRRVGFQTAFRMTLTTLPISAQEAWTAHLVDEVSEHPLDNLRRLWLRVSKLETATVKNVKAYFREMWLISEQMEELAVAETNRLAADPVVIRNITDYIEFQKFPWDEK